MSWYTPMPGSAFNVRPYELGDVDRVVNDMNADLFAMHFDRDLLHTEAIRCAVNMLRGCRNKVTMTEHDGRPFYIVGLHESPEPELVRGFLWGLPSRRMRPHAGAIAHWARRRLVPHLRATGDLPIATAQQDVAMNDRWIVACGGKLGTIQNTPMLIWE